MSEYRASIINTYKYLLTIRIEIITQAINIAMIGEHKDINDTIDVGDTYKFDIEQFRETKDANLNKLIDFYDEVEGLMNSIANINAIKEEDLEDEQ